jgi:tRNA wybutosine-synthesizing protein 1
MDARTKKQMERAGYRFAGNHLHSAAKICEWTRKSLRGKGVCYKEKWYGIKSHRCLQCSVCLYCLNKCLYCWRGFRGFSRFDIRGSEIDEPDVILEQLIEAQRKLLTGFGGHPDVDKKKYREAQNPANFAISLIGESLLYPKISDFIKEIHKRGGSSFLVTKGTVPEALEKLEEEPTNLYISLCAPTEEIFKRLEKPIVSDGWERQMKSLEIANSFSCRKVVRMTMVKGWNMVRPELYAKLIDKMGADFIELKAYMHVGESQKRLPRSAMPLVEEIEKFAKRVGEETGYHYIDTFRPSRVVLLGKKKSVVRS